MCSLADPEAFRSFDVNSGNRFAWAAARAVASDPVEAYNPLLIYGPSGAGKSHLLRAIEETITRRGCHRVATMPGTELVSAAEQCSLDGDAAEVFIVDDLTPSQFAAVRQVMSDLVRRGAQVVAAVRGNYTDVRHVYVWMAAMPLGLVADTQREPLNAAQFHL